MNFSLISLLILAAWFYSGLFTLAYVDKNISESRISLPWLNCIILFLGPLVLALFWLIYSWDSDWLQQIKNKFKRSDIDINLVGSSGATVLDPNRPHSNPGAIVLIRTLLSDAILQHAGIITFTPHSNNSMAIYYQNESIPSIGNEINLDLANTMITELKSASGIPPLTGRGRQDGNFSADLPGGSIRIHVTAEPTPDGEKMTIRLSEIVQAEGIGLEQLELTDSGLTTIHNALRKPAGVILVAGPPRSGRTTAIYAIMQEIDPKLRVAVSVEDLIIKAVPGIAQKEASGIEKSALIDTEGQQTPDIMFIDELSDVASTKAAFEVAKETLVVAVIHGNSFYEVLEQLRSLGISNQTISQRLRLILQVRYARELCQCKRKGGISPALLNRLQQAGIDGSEACQPIGCKKCHRSGYQGTTMIAVALPFSASLRELYDLDGVPRSIIQDKLTSEFGSDPLTLRGYELVASGCISEAELNRALQAKE